MTVLGPSLKNPEAKFYGSSKGYPAKQRAAGESIVVETVTVGETDLVQSLSAPGESVALESIEVRSEINGIVEAVFVEEGDWVKTGQPLVQLDQSSLLDEVRIAENNVANDQQNLYSVIESAENDIAKLAADVEKAERRVANAKARLATGLALVEDRQSSAQQSAEAQLNNAAERLERIQGLVEQGALSQFELLKAEDEFAQRQHESFEIQQGNLGDNERAFSDKDFLISRRLQLQRAQLSLERALTLEPGKIEKAQLRLETRQAQLRETQRNLERTVVKASNSGLISVLSVDQGELVGSSSREPMMLLNQDILFEAFIDQAQLNQVEEGDVATVRLTAYPGEVFTGRVVRVNPTIETEHAKQNKVGVDRQYTYSVWVEMDEDLQMPPGLQGYVQFGKVDTALSIPEHTLIHLSGGEGMVMVIENGKAIPRSVKVGALLDNQRKVIDGLALGEKVILNPYALQPGDLVSE
ncbi:HlyD family secretion protein [Leptolyngbya sp. Heron Island J]|uniref:HlyD family secretion protein n=1 Tax=Leptolyngbya sp. Heron Island J TaxID=1385935 RepID=UPI0013779250|nr:efflux RND transporter periplasmic adaptor subunit [Leptolyngbya sp. Heron Island J]